MKTKRMAVFNDISGFGRCSLTAAMPIISACGVECCPAVTAVLSRQTAFEGYKCFELTEQLDSIVSDWKQESFDGIYTGFFTNKTQTDIAKKFISDHPETKAVVVDPVLGDGGELYPISNKELICGIKELISLADVITPNLTELGILTDSDISNLKKGGFPLIAQAARRLLGGKLSAVVVTGIDENKDISNCVVTAENYSVVRSHRYAGYFSGTGDIFSSVLAAKLVGGEAVLAATESAASFVEKCIKNTETVDNDTRYGTNFYDYIKEL